MSKLKKILENIEPEILVDVYEFNIQEPENVNIVKELFFTTVKYMSIIKKKLNRKQQMELVNLIKDSVERVN